MKEKRDGKTDLPRPQNQKDFFYIYVKYATNI